VRQSKPTVPSTDTLIPASAASPQEARSEEVSDQPIRATSLVAPHAAIAQVMLPVGEANVDRSEDVTTRGDGFGGAAVARAGAAVARRPWPGRASSLEAARD